MQISGTFLIDIDNTNQSFNNLVKAAQNEQWMRDNSIDTSFAESTRASYEEMQNYQQSISQKQELVHSYNSVLQAASSGSASDDRDMYHEVEKGIMQQYGVSQNESHQMIESNDSRVNKVWDGIVEQELGRTVAAVSKGEQYINDKSTAGQLNFALENQNKVNNQNVQDVRQQATDQGLEQNKVRQNIQNQGNVLQNQQEKITNTNDVLYENIKNDNENIQESLKERAQKYEDNRVQKHMGIGGPTVKHLNNKDK